MYIPFISKVSAKRAGFRRQIGGGFSASSAAGRPSTGGRSSSTGSTSSTSGRSTSSGGRSPVSIGSGATTGGRASARPYGNGGGPVTTIPAGQPFAGRTQGGGTRSDIYGSRTYGSGYPGIQSRGVAGLGFPFFFWPVVWGSAAAGGVGYLVGSEYGEPNNNSRPGGELTTVPFSSSSGNTTLHLIADRTTTTSLLSSISTNCSSNLASISTGSQTILAYDPSNNSMPKPEQAIQYYRASSIVLTLDGYNNTVALNESATLNDTGVPLPSWINTGMLDCVNQTIGEAAPLIDSVIHLGPRSVGVMGLLWLLDLCFDVIY